METNVEKLMKNTKKQLVELYLKVAESATAQEVEKLKEELDGKDQANKLALNANKQLKQQFDNLMKDCRGTAKVNEELKEEIDELATKLVTLQKDHKDLKTLAWCLGGIALAMMVVVFIML